MRPPTRAPGEVGRGDHALSLRRQLAREQLAPLGVQLAHHVVEQHHRRLAALAGYHRALGQEQCEQGQSLLAL